MSFKKGPVIPELCVLFLLVLCFGEKLSRKEHNPRDGRRMRAGSDFT